MTASVDQWKINGHREVATINSIFQFTPAKPRQPSDRANPTGITGRLTTLKITTTADLRKSTVIATSHFTTAGYHQTTRPCDKPLTAS
jgi:hypothetical protein